MTRHALRVVILALVVGLASVPAWGQDAKGQRLVFASTGFDESNRFWVVARPDHPRLR